MERSRSGGELSLKLIVFLKCDLITPDVRIYFMNFNTNVRCCPRSKISSVFFFAKSQKRKFSSLIRKYPSTEPYSYPTRHLFDRENKTKLFLSITREKKKSFSTRASSVKKFFICEPDFRQHFDNTQLNTQSFARPHSCDYLSVLVSFLFFGTPRQIRVALSLNTMTIRKPNRMVQSVKFQSIYFGWRITEKKAKTKIPRTLIYLSILSRRRAPAAHK